MLADGVTLKGPFASLSCFINENSKKRMLAILARVRRVGSSQAAMPGLVYHSHGIEVDYTVDNKAALGEGGFGQVCKAVHNATKQERACKRIQKKDVKDKKAFEREV